MEIAAFSEMQEEFLARVSSVVWCSVASIDRHGRPRSRVLHPIWEVVDGQPVGYIATRRNSHKARHLERNPYVSVAYVGEPAKPVYADCRAEWVDSLEEKERVWSMYANAPHPLGYDPAPIFVSPDHENFGLLKLVPWRIEVYSAVTLPIERYIWRSEVERKVP